MTKQSLEIVNVVDGRGLEAALRARVAGEVRFDRLSRALYSTDASVYQIVPVGAVLPKSEDDIAAVVEICSQFRVPLTARGGGTSQAGQCIGPGVILDCSKHFNQILEINAAERWARVQPGCVLDDLNLAAKPHGLQFAPDISTSNRATIGGMVANNSSGTHSVIHGKTIDHVLGLRVLLSDGSKVETRRIENVGDGLPARAANLVRRLAIEHQDEIHKRFPKILRRVGGYNLDAFTHHSPLTTHSLDLTKLFVGSEGTLGVTLEAKLKLIELPRAKGVIVLHFAELLNALAITPAILAHGPSAIEVIDKYVLDSTKLNAEASRIRGFLHGDPGAILIVEFYGDTADEVRGKLDALEADLAPARHDIHVYRAKESADQAHVWKLRKLALGLSMAEKGDAKAISFVEDTAVAPEKLRDYIEEFLGVIKKYGTTAGVYAHASVGCLHVRPIVNLKTVEGVQQFQAIADEVANLVLKYGGAISGEHGDGLVRSPFQEKMFGPVIYNAFREIKKTLDPLDIFNPGKIVNAKPQAADLRYGSSYITPEIETTFDFSADGGIVRAAELCAGVGECRKKRDGVMCPSYQATMEEQHSTRGRANTLRLAMTGQLGMSGLTDPAVKEALDLCLECKACKSECPTNVDMARLKAEFLHQHHRKHGLPWRNWIFGNVDKLSRRWLLNKFSRTRLARWLNEKLFGIDSRRVPPPRRREGEFTWQLIMDRDYWLPKGVEQDYDILLFEQWQGAQGFPNDTRPRALIFPDTFTEEYEPRIGMGVAQLLRRLECKPVTVLPKGFKNGIQLVSEQPVGMRCCGRPQISNGMLDQARSHARYNVESLFPWAATGKSILACEPSCILTIKDDYPALLRGEERKKAEVVAAACRTFEEFLEESFSREPPASAESALAGGSRLNLRPFPHKILVQPHCHQRALVGTGALMKLLKRIPQAEVIDPDAGCCGMAGSFGYEKEHYEISRLVGEQRLFPAIRKLGPEDVIVAPGFSCRMQIEHFTGRKAVHPAELLAGLIET